VEEWLLGRPFERLENVWKGGLLRDFVNSQLPHDAQQSVDRFKSWFRTTFTETVVDKLIDQFDRLLEKKADTAVNRR
jgi:protoporphyrinogen oxidase